MKWFVENDFGNFLKPPPKKMGRKKSRLAWKIRVVPNWLKWKENIWRIWFWLYWAVPSHRQQKLKLFQMTKMARKLGEFIFGSSNYFGGNKNLVQTIFQSNCNLVENFIWELECSFAQPGLLPSLVLLHMEKDWEIAI